MTNTLPETINSKSRVLFDNILQKKTIKDIISSLKDHHPETYKHSLRVGLLSIDLGHDNLLNGNNLEYLGYAGLLHDMEKTKIPASVLSKNGALNEDEKTLMQRHPRLVFEVLPESGFDEIIREIVVAHHEFQANPYPRNGIEQRENNRSTPDRRQNGVIISNLAQIVAAADMFDALVHDRSYKKGLSKDETIEILRSQFTGNTKYIDQVILRYNMGKKIE